MLSTGDVQGCLRKLETLLRVIKYPGYVDYNGLSQGDPSAFLPIVSFTLTSFSPPFAEQLMATGLELTGKSDLRFTDTLYKVLRDIFHYKPILTKQQFLQWGFSQRKISVICDIINLVLQKHSQLQKTRVRYPGTHKDRRGEAHPTLTEADAVPDRPFVVNHAKNPSTCPTHRPHVEAFSSDSPGNGVIELAGGEEGKDNIVNSSEVEGRLSALEAQLESLSGLHRLSVLEKRLEQLERRRNTDENFCRRSTSDMFGPLISTEWLYRDAAVQRHEHDNSLLRSCSRFVFFFSDEGQVITISKESWENLMSRVLLLETKLELSHTQLNAPPPCLSSASSCSYSAMSDASKEDLKASLDRITNMLKSTSSLLKNTETPCK